MFQKKINGAWSNIETVKRKTSGIWSSCSEIKKKIDGVWTLIWIPAKSIGIYSKSDVEVTIKEYDGNIRIQESNYNSAYVVSNDFYLAPYHAISYDYSAYDIFGKLTIGIYLTRSGWMGSIDDNITASTSSGVYSFKNSFNETVKVSLLIRISRSVLYIKKFKLIETNGDTVVATHKLFIK